MSCTYKGEPTGRLLPCPPCAGNVRLKELHCSHPKHGTTTERFCMTCLDKTVKPKELLEVAVERVKPTDRPHGHCCHLELETKTCGHEKRKGERVGPAVCRSCRLRELEPTEYPLGKRHLLYHIYPRRGNGVWQRNIEQIGARIDQFDGRRVVAVVTDFSTDPVGAVREALGEDGIDYVERPNTPSHREVSTLRLLLDQVRDAPKEDSVFYAHAKGVGRQVEQNTTTHRWTDVMYEVCLDHPALVDHQLVRKPVTGPFKKDGFFFNGSASAWHYSGTFFWFRGDLFQRDWTRMDAQWWGAESYLGLHFQPEEAGCLFLESPSMDLYSMDYWRSTVLPELEKWRKINQRTYAQRTSLPTLGR